MVMLLFKKRKERLGFRHVRVVLVRVNRGEVVCLMQVRLIDYISFFRLHVTLLHIYPTKKLG